MRNLRKRREKAGLSRLELAKAAEVHPETIRGIEEGTTDTSVERARRLAKALGCSIEDLIGARLR